MADEPGTVPAGADAAGTVAAGADAVVDRASEGAEGLRKTSRWIAAALGGIPALSVLGSLIRAPGEAGFDGSDLALGVAFAAAGALLGIFAFAHVLAPVQLEDGDLSGFEMSRIPSVGAYADYRSLTAELAELTSVEAEARLEASNAQIALKEGEAAAASAEASAIRLEAAVKADPTDKPLTRRAEAARARADQLRRDADAAAAKVASLTEQADQWKRQIDARSALQDQVYKLGASDAVATRFRRSRALTVVAVALVAAGVVLLALAPIEKPTEDSSAGSAPTLVTLRLYDAGRRALRCEATSLQAIQVGGDAKSPEVITFPIEGCPARFAKFQVADPQPMGVVTTASPIEPPPSGG